MARKLKVFHASIGFFELAVAAPSMKAASEAWGSNQDIFKNGLAKETDDGKIVEAAMASPGVVLRRPVGSDDPFSQKAALPKVPDAEKKPPQDRPAANANKKQDTEDDQRQAEGLARKKEQEAEALARKKAEDERERLRKQREQAIAKANAEFEKATARHEGAVKALARRQDELDQDIAQEKKQWEEVQREHKDALKALDAEG